MQAPPPTGTTGKAPPGVRRLGAGCRRRRCAGRSARSYRRRCRCAWLRSTDGRSTSDHQKEEPHDPAELHAHQNHPLPIRCGAGGGATPCGWPSAGAGLRCGVLPGQVRPRMHPQSSPIMQPPGSGSGASRAGTTRKAPPPVRPPESCGGAGISLDTALAAGVADVGALAGAPTAAPHPTIKTHGRGTAQSDSRRAFVHHAFPIVCPNVTSI